MLSVSIKTARRSTLKIRIFRGVARIFQEGGGGGGVHAVSHPGYLPDWHVDIQAVFY